MLSVVTGRPLEVEGPLEVVESRELATGEFVAVLPDDLVPARGWAAALLRAHRMPWDGVGHAVAPSEQETDEEWAHFLVRWGPWCRPAPPVRMDRLPPGSAYRQSGTGRNFYLEPLAEVSALPGHLARLSPRPLRALARLGFLVPAARRLNLTSARAVYLAAFADDVTGRDGARGNPRPPGKRAGGRPGSLP